MRCRTRHNETTNTLTIRRPHWNTSQSHRRENWITKPAQRTGARHTFVLPTHATRPQCGCGESIIHGQSVSKNKKRRNTVTTNKQPCAVKLPAVVELTMCMQNRQQTHKIESTAVENCAIQHKTKTHPITAFTCKRHGTIHSVHRTNRTQRISKHMTHTVCLYDCADTMSLHHLHRYNAGRTRHRPPRTPRQDITNARLANSTLDVRCLRANWATQHDSGASGSQWSTHGCVAHVSRRRWSRYHHFAVCMRTSPCAQTEN